MEPVYLKLFVPICIMFICYCQYKLEYEHSDKRTKENKRRRWGLIGGNIFLAVISGVIIYSDDQGAKTLNSDLAKIKDSNDSLRTLVTETQLQAHNERMKLQEEITNLDSSLEPFRTIAVRRFGSLSESEALSQLAGDVKRLGKRLEEELTSINTLETEINIEMDVNWIDNKPPDFPALLMINGGSDTWIDVRNKARKVRRLELFSDGTVPQITASEKSVTINYRRKAAAGSWIIGRDKTELVGSEGFQIWLYNINSSIVRDQKVFIVSIEIMFFVNGDYYCKLLLHPNRSKELTNKEGSRSILVRYSSNFSFASLSQVPR